MVSFDFLDRRSAERFAELLDESGAGRHHDDQPAEEELAELVAIGHSLSTARLGAQVDTEFRVGLRAMLVATAERDGIGVTAVRAEAEPVAGHVAVRAPRRGLLGHAAGRRIRARGAIVIGVAAGAMAVSGISAASENATPGDALYGVKRSTERAQLAMAGSDVTRGQLALDFARNRLAEATALGGSNGFAGVLDDMDADTRQGVRLLTTSAVDRKDNTPLDTVDRFVTKQRIVLTPAIVKLSPANQKRAADSLALLDKVEERAEDLMARLACDPIGHDGTDALGPKLDDCMTGTGDSGVTEQPDGKSEKQGSKSVPADSDGSGEKSKTVKPAPSDSPASPGATGAAVPADKNPGRSDGAPASANPAPDEVVPYDPRADEENELLNDQSGRR
jgi:hypothetical protein